MTQYRRQIDASTCCNNWKNGIRTIDGQYPDDNRDFDINAGAGILISPATGGITITNIQSPGVITAGQNIEITPSGDNLEIATTDDIAVAGDLSVAGDSTLNGDLNVNGDIFQQGASYESHMEQVYTNNDYIIMRDGAVAALPSGDYAGFQVKKYDGTNDGRLVIDNSGTARVGDVGNEQPLLTREESANLNDGALLKWNAGNSKAVDEGTVGSDTKPIKIVNGVATAVTDDLVDTATSQQIGGDKSFNGNLTNELSFNAYRNLSTNTPASDEIRPIYTVYNSDGSVRQANLYLQKDTSGVLSLNVELRKNDGTYKYVRLADSA